MESNEKSKYKLVKVVIMSRHNIRSPLTVNGSFIETMTPNKWFNWTSSPSETSLKGEILETIFGQYFRKYMEKEGLINVNYIPKSDKEILFYSNAMQRTISTAKFFSSGAFPLVNVRIKYNRELNKMDEVFNPVITIGNETYKNAVVDEVKKIYDNEDINDTIKHLKPNFRVLEKILNLKESKYAKTNNKAELSVEIFDYKLTQYKEPELIGDITRANSCADALLMQYYEEPNDEKASFGLKTTYDDWLKIGQIFDTFETLRFGIPILAYNIANKLLKEIKSELQNEERIFSYICGHDANIISILTSLENEKYELEDNMVQSSPIGGKIVFEKRINQETNKAFIKIYLIYQGISQLRNCALMNSSYKPLMTEIKLKGLSQNNDGYYDYEDIMKRFDYAIEQDSVLPGR